MAAASSSPSAGGRPGRSRRLPGSPVDFALGARSAAGQRGRNELVCKPRGFPPANRSGRAEGYRSRRSIRSSHGQRKWSGPSRWNLSLVHDQRLHESDPVSPDSSSINSSRLRVRWAVLSNWARSVWRAESRGMPERPARNARPPTAPGGTWLLSDLAYPVRPRNRTRPARWSARRISGTSIGATASRPDLCRRGDYRTASLDGRSASSENSWTRL